jgi:hypothetical protein
VVPEQYIEKIRDAFLDALYSFLDGLVHLAFADPERPNNGESSGSRSLENLNGGGKKAKAIDITQLDSRILITISNLSELRSVTIPKMLTDFEKTCSVSIAGDGKVLSLFWCHFIIVFHFSISSLLFMSVLLLFLSTTCNCHSWPIFFSNHPTIIHHFRLSSNHVLTTPFERKIGAD